MPGSSSMEPAAHSSTEPIPATIVREQLARIVNSPGFTPSARLVRFLTHIVNRTVDGDPDSPKEFSIALEVFDRTAEYDPNIDAIVRVEARRLRSKLKAYYEEGAGRDDPVLIGLRPGSYVPIFRWLERASQEHKEEARATIEARRASIAVLSAFTQGYVQRLPNLFCEEKTERYTNAVQKASGPSFAPNLHHRDRLTWTLRYINGREEGNIVRFAKKHLTFVGAEAGQSASTGEFGGDLLVFFGPSRDTQIAWDHWEWVDGRRIAVFRYFNGEHEPRFILSWHSPDTPIGPIDETVQAAIRGLVFFDSETGAVERLTFEAVNLPIAFPIQKSRTIVDYGEIAIGDRSYLLPKQASVFMEAGQVRTLNEIVFRKYRKFEAESTVSFTNSQITYPTPSKK